MWPGRVSNPGPLTYESGALPTALRGTAGLGVGSEWFLRYKALNEVKRVRHAPQGDPLSVSLDVS